MLITLLVKCIKDRSKVYKLLTRHLSASRIFSTVYALISTIFCLLYAIRSPGSTVEERRDFLLTMSLAALAASAADCASMALAHTADSTCHNTQYEGA